MYSQIIGCLIMGIFLQHKKFMFDHSPTRLRRVIYIGVTTGLCGSITTFGSWNLQCNRSFFLQWDTSWGSAIGSYNGGRLLEWLLCMWTGTVVPLAALKLGRYIAKFSNYEDDKFPSIKSPVVSPLPAAKTVATGAAAGAGCLSNEEVLVLIVFAVSTVLILALPAYVFPTWVFFAYTAAFGACGANLRFQISASLNPRNKNFPLGTFIVNVLGSSVLAVVTTVAKFAVEYNDLSTQVNTSKIGRTKHLAVRKGFV